MIELSDETTKVAILAATGCVKSGLYQNELSRLGGRPPYILPGSLQETAMLSINQTKAGEIDEACRTLGPLLRFLREEEEVEMVVLGCTEFPVIVESLGEDVPEGEGGRKARHIAFSNDFEPQVLGLLIVLWSWPK